MEAAVWRSWCGADGGNMGRPAWMVRCCPAEGIDEIHSIRFLKGIDAKMHTYPCLAFTDVLLCLHRTLGMRAGRAWVPSTTTPGREKKTDAKNCIDYGDGALQPHYLSCFHKPLWVPMKASLLSTSTCEPLLPAYWTRVPAPPLAKQKGDKFLSRG
ncbi:hypothetical protein SADUNF_Sadunf06G0175600 [Salix dunnii]|uniref:Uncharacterized protein n=1 Tax=Salix dunnii TaxID=1413687 RepID=A0A835K2S2_9ROSI|nr:hypothetical protein SADUNF_Sadunf06G0175600 [Salix dunnii]